MRRTHLRGHENILKRLLVHIAGFNLGLLLRNLLGTGTPKQYAELRGALCRLLARLHAVLDASWKSIVRSLGNFVRYGRLFLATPPIGEAAVGTDPATLPARETPFSTGC